MVPSLSSIGAEVISILKGLFKTDEDTRMVSVETLVVLTTMLLVARFLLDFLGPWHGILPAGTLSVMRLVAPAMETVNQSLVHYTMGRMQLSALGKNDYFQVWAALLVTLQFSVKVGHPYSRSMQTPLLDIMSSLWAANLLRVQTAVELKVPLWLIWALNAARIVSYFSSSDKAESANQESTRLVADYMSYEHKLGVSQSQALASVHGLDNKQFDVRWCKYLVLGEHQVVKELRIQQEQAGTIEQYGVQLDPEVHAKLITLDKIWSIDNGLLGTTADPANRLKDVCLSFALYKLLRRRFYNLPIHEARLLRAKKKMRTLVFDYILHDAERAFRVAAVEVSFLQDLFYSKRAAIFAARFPVWNLVLSLSLAAVTGYLMHPVRLIPQKRVADKNISQGGHGVFVTGVMVALIVSKELAEVYLYVFSGWTKVLLLCSYTTAKHRYRQLVKMAIRAMLCFMPREKGQSKVRQYNVLTSYRVPLWLFFIRIPFSFKLEECTKKAIFKSLRYLENKEPDSYLANAFNCTLICKLSELVNNLESDTHKILVWHIATCLCEIGLHRDAAKKVRPSRIRMWSRPLFARRKPKPDDRGSSSFTTAGTGQSTGPDEEEAAYVTAVTLSNYCAYLVMKTLVPDNALVAVKILDHVQQEIANATGGERNMRDIFGRLMREAEEDMTETDEAEEDMTDSLTRRGAKVAKILISELDGASLWKKLETFWTGFLLHLAASTSAGTHKIHLSGRRELTTELWALLSHAGISRSTTNHGGQPSLVLLNQLNEKIITANS